MGCQPTKMDDRYIAHGDQPTPEVLLALQFKGLKPADLVYWWRLTPAGYRKLHCNLCKGCAIVPLAVHLAVGQAIIFCLRQNLLGGLVVLCRDRIFKVQIRGGQVREEGASGGCCTCCCGGAEWEMDMVNVGTAQPGEVVCLPVIKLGGTENPPVIFVHDTVKAQKLIGAVYQARPAARLLTLGIQSQNPKIMNSTDMVHHRRNFCV